MKFLSISINKLNKNISDRLIKNSSQNTAESKNNKESLPQDKIADATTKEQKNGFLFSNAIKKFQEKVETSIKDFSLGAKLNNFESKDIKLDTFTALLKDLKSKLEPKKELVNLTPNVNTDNKSDIFSNLIKKIDLLIKPKQELQNFQQYFNLFSAKPEQQKPDLTPKAISEKSDLTKLQTSLLPTKAIQAKPEEIKPAEFKSELKPEEKIQKVTINSFSSEAIKAFKVSENFSLSEKKLETLKHLSN